MTATVAVDDETLEKLAALANEIDIPVEEVLARAVERFRREHFLEMGNLEYERLRADSVAWAEELEERRLWDNTLMDGLEDDPYPLDPDQIEDMEATLAERARREHRAKERA